MEGVVKVRPVPSGLPPEALLNHATGCAELAVSVTVPGPHLLASVAIGAAGTGLMIACAAARVLVQVVPASA